MSLADAAVLGLEPIGLRREAAVAGGSMRDIDSSILAIEWLGRSRRVEVMLDLDGTSSREQDPVILIGTRLLSPHLLLVDFEAETVEIETQE